MPKYGPPLYGAEETAYGASSTSALSANPMRAVVLLPGIVSVSWTRPTAPGIEALRLVRSQTGHPEWEEDGSVLLHESSLADGSTTSTSLEDGRDVPLSPGRYAYYSVFVRLAGGWRRIGRTEVLVPGRPDLAINYGTPTDAIYLPGSTRVSDTFVDLLPRVLTNPEKDAIGTPDPDSPLCRFVAAMALTLDDIRTISDLLLPSSGYTDTPPGIIPAAFMQRGLTTEPALGLSDQKRVLRESATISQKRGTTLGLAAYVEALTGWAPTVTKTKNMVRYLQSATFSGGVGEWAAAITDTGAVSLTTSTTATRPTHGDVRFPSPSPYPIGVFTGQDGRAELPAGGWNINPLARPSLLRVKPNTTYTFSAYFFGSNSGTNSVAKTFRMGVRGYATATSDLPLFEWPIGGSAMNPITGEWRLDDPFDWPRAEAVSFTLPTGANSWQRKSVTFNTGPSVSRIALAVNWTAASSDSFRMGSVALTEGPTAPAWDPPGSAVVEVAPSRTNLVWNPAFGVSAAGWTLSGLTDAASTTVPGDVMVTTSRALTAAGAWSAETNVASSAPYTNSAATTLTGSLYATGGGAAGYDISLQMEAVGDTADGPMTITQTVTANTGSTPTALTSVDIEDGVMTAGTAGPHRLSVGQSVVLGGLGVLNGTYAVAGIPSDNILVCSVVAPDQYLSPAECAAATVSPNSLIPWVRPEVSISLPAGTWTTVRLTVLGTSAVTDLLITGALLEASSVRALNYFDGSSPGQYGVEWRGVANNSPSDMHLGRLIKAIRLDDTLIEYLPRHAGAVVVTPGGTVLASIGV